MCRVGLKAGVWKSLLFTAACLREQNYFKLGNSMILMIRVKCLSLPMRLAWGSICRFFASPTCFSLKFDFRSIRRIIFYSLIKPTVNEKGEKEMDVISVSSALQIAGRAGRFNTQYEKVSCKDSKKISKCKALSNLTSLIDHSCMSKFELHILPDFLRFNF